jgi:hypothetical protein
MQSADQHRTFSFYPVARRDTAKPDAITDSGLSFY